jgi:hypothetical protein
MEQGFARCIEVWALYSLVFMQCRSAVGSFPLLREAFGDTVAHGVVPDTVDRHLLNKSIHSICGRAACSSTQTIGKKRTGCSACFVSPTTPSFKDDNAEFKQRRDF